MSKILITSFEPFGLIGSWVRGNNASKQVMEKLQKEHGNNFTYATFPTSDEGIAQFEACLQKENPTGILSMGEHLLAFPEKVKIEPFANDTSVSVMPLKHLFSDTVTSDFVTSINEPQDSSLIGGYYCNQIYLRGLNWSKQNGNPPVAFAHIPVLGNHNEHTSQVLGILEKMEQYNVPNTRHEI